MLGEMVVVDQVVDGMGMHRVADRDCEAYENYRLNWLIQRRFQAKPLRSPCLPLELQRKSGMFAF